MHEMGIATEIIRIVEASIPPDMAGSKVTRITLKVGKLSAVAPSSLRFCLEAAGKESLVAGAELDIMEVPVSARCDQCENLWELDQPVFSCPKCKSGAITVLAGRELDIDAIEIEPNENENESVSSK